MCSKILLLRSPCTSSTAPLSIQLATITTRSQLPTDRKIGQIRGICCSQGGMGRKKGELSQKSVSQNKSKLASAPTCQDSSGTQAAGSPLQLDKTGSSTLISIAAKPGAKHSSVTHLSEVRALTFYISIHTVFIEPSTGERWSCHWCCSS